MKSNSTLKAERLIGYAECKSLFLSSHLLVIVLLFISVNKANAQPPVPEYPTLTFNSPVLIEGTDLQVGAVYNFPNVTDGVDARVTIMGMTGGAWLSEIDNTTGAGYYDAFQPYVGAGGYDTSYIDWKFVFKKAGTDIDTILPVLAVTGVDVDGDASSLKEFIQAATPGSFALDPSTYLNFSFDGVRSTATSTVDNYALIDTANKRSMFQMNFTNINTILYRNGAITTGGSQIRQTSIYFKSFFNFQTLLPVKLLSFEAKALNNETKISWSATGEEDLKNYMVQKSTDGKNWHTISTISPASQTSVNNYSITDNEENNATVYYRLQQVSTNGAASYSKTIKLANTAFSSLIANSFGTADKISLQVKSKSSGDYMFEVYSITGAKIISKRDKVYAGTNQYVIGLPATSAKGIFILVLKDKSGQVIYNNKVSTI